MLQWYVLLTIISTFVHMFCNHAAIIRFSVNYASNLDILYLIVTFFYYYMSPLWETYIGLSVAYVRPSVRASVRNASLVRAISPRIVNIEFSSSQKNILTEVVQQKIKIQIFPNILRFWPKKNF